MGDFIYLLTFCQTDEPSVEITADRAPIGTLRNIFNFLSASSLGFCLI